MSIDAQESRPHTVRESSDPLFKETIDLLGGTGIIKGKIRSDLEAHDVIVKRFSGKALVYVVKHARILKRSDVSAATGVSLRTAQRIDAQSTKLLSSEQSGRLWKFAEVLAKAIEVFGTREEAEKWLAAPAIALEKKRPVDLLRSPVGVELVEQLLGRLEYNVYT
jgi:putative toxin-antitoxin system antitoxin component (TIGR02293 family)